MALMQCWVDQCHYNKQYTYQALEENSRKMPKSFIQEMWPILSAMRLWGWLPVHRDDRNKLEIRSLILLYTSVAILSQCLPAIYIVVIGFKMIPYMASNRHLLTYAQLICGIVIPQISCAILGVTSSKNVAFLNQLQKFQSQLERISLSENPLNFNFKSLSTFTFIMHLVPIFIIMAVIPLALGKQPSWTLDIYISFTFANTFVLLGFWIGVMKFLQALAQRLTEEMRILGEYNELGEEKTGRLVGRQALLMRPLWLHLCHLVHSSGNAIAVSMGLLMFDLLLISVYSAHQLVNMQYISAYVFFSNSLLFGGATFYMICLHAHTTSVQVYLELIEAIRLSKKLKTDKIIQREMIRFFVRLSRRSPEINLQGYVTVRRGLFSTMVSTVIGNLLILYQLRINQERLDIREIFKLGN